MKTHTRKLFTTINNHVFKSRELTSEAISMDFELPELLVGVTTEDVEKLEKAHEMKQRQKMGLDTSASPGGGASPGVSKNGRPIDVIDQNFMEYNIIRDLEKAALREGVETGWSEVGFFLMFSLSDVVKNEKNNRLIFY